MDARLSSRDLTPGGGNIFIFALPRDPSRSLHNCLSAGFQEHFLGGEGKFLYRHDSVYFIDCTDVCLQLLGKWFVLNSC